MIDDMIGPVEGSNPYASGLPVVEDQRLAKRYAEIFRVFRSSMRRSTG